MLKDEEGDERGRQRLLDDGLIGGENPEQALVGRGAILKRVGVGRPKVQKQREVLSFIIRETDARRHC